MTLTQVATKLKTNARRSHSSTSTEQALLHTLCARRQTLSFGICRLPYYAASMLSYFQIGAYGAQVTFFEALSNPMGYWRCAFLA